MVVDSGDVGIKSVDEEGAAEETGIAKPMDGAGG